jgi:hypothetical protein
VILLKTKSVKILLIIGTFERGTDNVQIPKKGTGVLQQNFG